jgi:hypothetical protein
MAENLDHHEFGGDAGIDRASDFTHGIQTPIRVISTASSTENVSSAFNFVGAANANASSGGHFKRPADVDHGGCGQSYGSSWPPATGYGGRDHNNNNDEVIKRMSGEISYLTGLVLEGKNSADSHSKRHRDEKSFRHLGNGVQYNCNAKALTHLDEAIYAFRSGNYQACEAAMVAARDILELRNHKILMADTSEYGWATVSAYETHDDYCDDDEEKRVRRAEGVAKIRKKDKTEVATKRGRGRGRGYSPRFQNADQNQYDYGYGNQGYQPFPAYAGPGAGPNAGQGGQPRPIPQCYKCKGWGHIKPNCPSPDPSFAYNAGQAPAK